MLIATGGIMILNHIKTVYNSEDGNKRDFDSIKQIKMI
jgi:hypothetical protein